MTLAVGMPKNVFIVCVCVCMFLTVSENYGKRDVGLVSSRRRSVSLLCSLVTRRGRVQMEAIL